MFTMLLLPLSCLGTLVHKNNMNADTVKFLLVLALETGRVDSRHCDP
jgi:hypothetical protein